MSPRLIRRRPLAERIKAYLDPVDVFLWLSEELDSSDWDKWQKDWASVIGLSLNLIFAIARANARSSYYGSDKVFDDGPSGSWWTWPAAFLVHFLVLLSFVNAFYTFYRSRHYRLFENPIETIPSTPSAQRVRVDSSPISSSPLRFLSKMISGETPEDRAHPDPTKHVWEVALWDPLPLSLQVFCMFSPGHVLLYWLLLPVAADNPHPSTSVVTAVLLALIMSAQLLFLRSSFSQQSKDSTIIHKEVMNEYDTKFVHPRSQPLMRDVGIQLNSHKSPASSRPRTMQFDSAVSTYPPAVVLNRNFRTRPNPNYSELVDPARSTVNQTPSRTQGIGSTTALQTPALSRDSLSPVRQQTAIKQPQFRSSGTGDGGSFGIYTHARSPLKKSASTTFGQPANPRERLANQHKDEGNRANSNPLSPLTNELRLGHYNDAHARRSSGRF